MEDLDLRESLLSLILLEKQSTHSCIETSKKPTSMAKHPPPNAPNISKLATAERSSASDSGFFKFGRE